MKHYKYVAITLVLSIFVGVLVACTPSIKAEGISVEFVERDINGKKIDKFLDVSNAKVHGRDGEKPTVKDAIIYVLEDQKEDYEFKDDVLEEAFDKEYEVDEDKREFSKWVILLNDEIVDDPEDETIKNGDEIECIWAESFNVDPEAVFGEQKEQVSTVSIKFVMDSGEVLLEHPRFDVICSTKLTPTVLMAAEQILQKYEQTYSLTDDGNSLYSVTLQGTQYQNEDSVDATTGYFKYWKCSINGKDVSSIQGATPIYSGDIIVFQYTLCHIDREDIREVTTEDPSPYETEVLTEITTDETVARYH